MDDYQLVILSFPIYVAIEHVFRFCVLFDTLGKENILLLSGKTYKFCHLLITILSPGLWVSEMCKESIKEIFSCSYEESFRKRQLSKFIKTSNKWNLIISFVLLAIALFREFLFIEENNLIFLACFMWRYISRSSEIVYAFVRDVLSPISSSDLDNSARMKLAINSYREIFIYSAAFYSAFSCNVVGIFEPILTSLFVGTLTNVSEAINSIICSCSSDLWYILLLKGSVYLQVFATLSLIFFAFAGYFSRVKTNTITKKTSNIVYRSGR